MTTLSRLPAALLFAVLLFAHPVAIVLLWALPKYGMSGEGWDDGYGCGDYPDTPGGWCCGVWIDSRAVEAAGEN